MLLLDCLLAALAVCDGSLRSLCLMARAFDVAYFVVARRRKACPLTSPQHGGARSGVGAVSV